MHVLCLISSFFFEELYNVSISLAFLILCILKITFHHLGINTSAHLLVNKVKRLFKGLKYRNNSQLSFAQHWWEFGTFMFREWMLLSMKTMEEQNIVFTLAPFLWTLAKPTQEQWHLYTALTSMDLRLSTKIYKAMVTFEMEKTLGDLVLIILVVGIWSQIERKSLWKGWGW